MLSTSKLYTTELLTEDLGFGIGAAGALLGYLFLTVKAKLAADKLETQFLESYQDSLLTIKIDIDENDAGISFPSVTTHGSLFKRIVNNGELDLVVNLKTANLLKQKFGKYPMFKILKTNESVSMDMKEFKNKHKSLLALMVENKIVGMANKVSDPDVKINLLYIGKVLTALMTTSISTHIKKLTFKSYKPKVTFNR